MHREAVRIYVERAHVAQHAHKITTCVRVPQHRSVLPQQHGNDEDDDDGHQCRIGIRIYQTYKRVCVCLCIGEGRLYPGIVDACIDACFFFCCRLHITRLNKNR